MLQISDRLDYKNLFFCYVVAFPSIHVLLNNFLSCLISGMQGVVTVLLYFFLILIIIKILPLILQSIGIGDFIFYLAFILIFVLSMLYPKSNTVLYTTVAVDIFTNCLCFYFGIKILDINDKLIFYMRMFAYIMIVSIFTEVIFFNSTSMDGQYSQYNGYVCLNVTALLMLPLLYNRKITDIVGLIFCGIGVIIFGARGPLVLFVVAIAVALCIYVWQENRKKQLVMFFGIAGTVFALLLDEIMSFFRVYIENSSFSTRNIDMLLNDSMFTDTSRMQIYEYAWGYCREHVFIGCGVLNDRILIQNKFQFDSAIGSYPHNIFLELMMQFGWVLGIIVFLILIFYIISTWISITDNKEKILFAEILVVGGFPLLFSSSYLSYAMFYALIGFCSRIKDRRIKLVVNKELHIHQRT